MKLQFINPHNVAHLVPEWLLPPFFVAKNIDEMLIEQPWMRRRNEFDSGHPGLHYMIAAKPRAGSGSFWDFEVSVWDKELLGSMPEEKRLLAEASMGRLIIETPTYALRIPITYLLRGSPRLEGAHTVYCHSLLLRSGPSDYVGITRRKWWERMAEHRSAAACGSNLLFHRAIRQHGGVRVTNIEQAGASYEQAMKWEEGRTTAPIYRTLYPHGLNMIPGGFAGLRYLAGLGHQARTLEERDAALTAVMKRERLTDGAQNPLCAARWASDQEYVNSVICGHSRRLTADQVRNIRMLSASGYDDAKIADVVADSPTRVRRVIDRQRYQRVA